MATRALLGPALAEAFTAASPAMRLLRHGVLHYWHNSTSGRNATMSLLSTYRSSVPLLAKEYLWTCLHALSGIRHHLVEPHEILPAIQGLAHSSLRQLRSLRDSLKRNP